MTAPRFTVDVIEHALEQGLAVITLMQLRDALQAGDVAILTKAERIYALDCAFKAGILSNDVSEEGSRLSIKAYTLLQLPVKEG